MYWRSVQPCDWLKHNLLASVGTPTGACPLCLMLGKWENRLYIVLNNPQPFLFKLNLEIHAVLVFYNHNLFFAPLYNSPTWYFFAVFLMGPAQLLRNQEWKQEPVWNPRSCGWGWQIRWPYAEAFLWWLATVTATVWQCWKQYWPGELDNMPLYFNARKYFFIGCIFEIVHWLWRRSMPKKWECGPRGRATAVELGWGMDFS